MKINFATLLLGFSTMSATFFQCSCKEESDPCQGHPSQTYNYYISAANKSKIPYSGNDTLTFENSTSNTAILIGQGRQATMKEYANYSTNNPGCPNLDHWFFENISTTFIGSHPQIAKITVTASIGGSANYYPPPWNDDGMTFLVYSANSPQTPFISCPNFASYANDNSRYTDSVVINGSTYRGVTLCDSSYLLYNYTNGILRFKDNNNTIWTRKL